MSTNWGDKIVNDIPGSKSTKVTWEVLKNPKIRSLFDFNELTTKLILETFYTTQHNGGRQGLCCGTRVPANNIVLIT